MPDFVSQYKIVISLVVAAVFLTLLTIEALFPLRKKTHSYLKRYLINLSVSGLAVATGAYAVAPVALSLALWGAKNSFGLLRIFTFPFAAEFILGFLLMDLTFYYWHWANHSLALFWRFHNVHHVDPDLDVTTSFRFHFGEVLYSAGFRALQVYLLGISLFTYLAYELVFQCATVFHHSNVRLPIAVERWLNLIVVTPRMHGVHHSTVKEEANSNFSVIFRWWDLLHGTLRLNVKQSDVVIGVPAYQDPVDNQFLSLIFLPFRKQKEYWRRQSGKPLERQCSHGSRFILMP
jgi:sterol desaturase/sphingolipid hydroxylase (fatty acid hydroxylase superfamily)